MNNQQSSLKLEGNFLSTTATDKDTPLDELLLLNQEINRLFEETMSEGIVAVNEEGVILSFNKRAGEIFGYSASEAIGKNIGDLILLEYPDKLHSCIINFLKINGEIKFLDKLCESSENYQDGPIVPVKFSVGKTHFSDRLLVTLSVQHIEREKLNSVSEEILVEKLMDVDQILLKKNVDAKEYKNLLQKEVDKRKHLEDKLRLSQAMSSVDARFVKAGRVAEQISRDFSNLLVPLQTFSKLLKSKLQGDSEWVQYCDTIEKVASRLTQVNDQLLALMSFNRQDPVTFDVNMVLDESTNLVGDFFKEEFTVNAEVPKEKYSIKGRPEQLYRVFFNLLLNAKEAINGSQGKISVKSEKVVFISDEARKDPLLSSEYAKISISDNGTGIPRENLNRIFDPFYSTKNGTRKKGSGFGLTIVKDMIRDHRGFIEVDSVVGQGTMFSIHLPLASSAN